MDSDERNGSIKERTRFLLNEYCRFINAIEIEESIVDINLFDLVNVTRRYYETTDYIHNEFCISGFTHSHKVAAYTTYWISKLKPIKITDNNQPGVKYDKKKMQKLIYINEMFAIFVGYGRLQAHYDYMKEDKMIVIEKPVFDHLVHSLLYKNPSIEDLSIIYYLIESK